MILAQKWLQILKFRKMMLDKQQENDGPACDTLGKPFKSASSGADTTDTLQFLATSSPILWHSAPHFEAFKEILFKASDVGSSKCEVLKVNLKTVEGEFRSSVRICAHIECIRTD